jgi:hypothetical protein
MFGHGVDDAFGIIRTAKGQKIGAAPLKVSRLIPTTQPVKGIFTKMYRSVFAGE